MICNIYIEQNKNFLYISEARHLDIITELCTQFFSIICEYSISVELIHVELNIHLELNIYHNHPEKISSEFIIQFLQTAVTISNLKLCQLSRWIYLKLRWILCNTSCYKPCFDNFLCIFILLCNDDPLTANCLLASWLHHFKYIIFFSLTSFFFFGFKYLQ